MEICKVINDSETDYPHLIATDPSADSKRSFKQLQVPINKNCPVNNMYKNIRFKYLFVQHLILILILIQVLMLLLRVEKVVIQDHLYNVK